MQSRFNFGFKWEKIFSVYCNHDYYADGRGNDFEFVPTNKTSVLFKNFKIFFKNTNNGFHVFCSPEQFKRIHPLKRVSDEKLTFLIKNKNNLLANYTNINFNHFEEAFHFSNIDIHKHDDQLILHKGEFCVDRKKLKIYSPFQVIRYDKMSKNAKLLDCRGKEVPKKAWYQKKHEMHVISLRNLPGGRYTLINGKDQLEFYLIDYIKDPVWGIIDIHLYHLPEIAQFITKDNTIKPLSYNINFQSRSTYWKYIIIGQSKELKLQLDEVKVNYNGDDLEMTKPKKVTLSNGVEAYRIETVNPMELKELTHVTDKLELKLKKNNKWQNKTYKIAKPTVKAVKPDRKTDKIYSTTYIYV